MALKSGEAVDIFFFNRFTATPLGHLGDGPVGNDPIQDDSRDIIFQAPSFLFGERPAVFV
jgi:hypothetical protein